MQDYYYVATIGIILGASLVIGAQPRIVLIMFFIFVLGVLSIKNEKEPFRSNKLMSPMMSFTKLNKDYCLKDDNPMAQNRMRMFESDIPTYLYNAEYQSDFAKFCFGHPRRFSQWNF